MRSNTLWSEAFKAFLAKWSRPFKRWTRKRRMGNTVEQNSPKQNISRFPLMETVKMRWLLTHELLWKSTVKANRRGSKHQLKHTKPGLSNNPLGNQYHPRSEITIIDNCQQYTEFFNLHSHNCIVTVMAQVGLLCNSWIWNQTLPKAQRTRGLSSNHKFKHKSWSNFICRIST